MIIADFSVLKSDKNIIVLLKVQKEVLKVISAKMIYFINNYYGKYKK